MKICFIGGGNMASALAGGLIAKGTAPVSIAMVDPRPEAREQLVARFGVTAHEACENPAAAASVIVLAVKPQQMRVAATALRPCLKQQLVITVAAGIRLADISRWLGGYRKMVRSMPNMPALIGQGISGLFAAPEVDAADRQTAETILAAVGATLWVRSEHLIDGITAVSGSGPAYVFYFIEALQQAAQKLGFSEAEARELALDTFCGASLLARDSRDAPAVLRERVTSKGGTTEAALAEFKRAGVNDAIVTAVEAANRRGGELGDLLGKD